MQEKYAVFNSLLPSLVKKTIQKENQITGYKLINQVPVFFKNFRAGKIYYEEGTITKRIGQVIYDIKGEKFQCKRHWNQLRPRHTTEVTENTKEIPVEVLYDAFEIPIPVNQGS